MKRQGPSEKFARRKARHEAETNQNRAKEEARRFYKTNHASFSTDQLRRLDTRLGKNVGAKRERKKLKEVANG